MPKVEINQFLLESIMYILKIVTDYLWFLIPIVIFVICVNRKSLFSMLDF
ncbi:hypothetical protein J2S77_002643 [Alkalibacillus salilacus]|uniref:Uncharacterized protein n=1 Tax=Alkalibacillus salilacus TaxID=284582 RepID=A0ABT9VIA1_9BACI|nr:hypothetical protein [Alkalibacillus salilacus]